MYRSYKINVLLTLVLTLTIGTSLMRFSDLHSNAIWQELLYVILLSVNISGSWIVHSYLKLHPPLHLSVKPSAWVSLFLGTIISLAIGYLFTEIFPQTWFFSDMLPKATLADFFKRLASNFFLNMVCFMIVNNLFTNDVLQRTRLENEQMKLAHLRVQLIGLQQQLSPHFLFNSFSTLKTLATDATTKNFIVQLSHVYRYLLTNKDQRIMKLSDELAFVKSYVYIQEKRFESALRVDIDIPQRYLNYKIPILTIQLLVENAIKHNAFSPDSPLSISIYVDEGGKLVVRNSFNPKMAVEENTGLGLQNINERLHLLFSESLEIIPSSKSFTVIIPLSKNENNHN